MVQRAIRRLLETSGLTVLEASNGREALEVLERHSVHMIVTDLRMPLMNGLELLDELDQSGARTDIQTVIYSAECPPRIPAGAIYIPKPKTDLLLAAVHDALGRPGATP